LAVTEEEKITRGVFVGVDVAKDRLDIALRPSGEKLIVPNDRRGTTRLVRTISCLTPECVVLEASGGSGDC
jgi:transposase